MDGIVVDRDARTFLDAVSDLLYQHEAANGLIIGVAEGVLRGSSAAHMLRFVRNGETVGVALQTPPYNLILQNWPLDQMDALARRLEHLQTTFPGVIGPGAEAEAFVQAWAKLTGKSYRLGMEQPIFELTAVTFPTGIHGAFILAGPEHEGLLVKWIQAFAAESLHESFSEEHWRGYVQGILSQNGASLWLVDGTPVSMAFKSRPTRNTLTVNFVYTPKEFRKRGFASAVTAALSQNILDSGKPLCRLCTDASNPTSNKIYQAMGYVRVGEAKHFVVS